MALTFKYGLYQEAPIENAPEEVNTAIAASVAITPALIDDVFRNHEATALNFSGKGIAPGAQDALSDALQKTMTVVELSLAGLRTTDRFSVSAVCSAALVENLSVQRVNLSRCNLTPSDAALLAENVIPWNRTLVDWDFSGNSLLGDEGVKVLVNAFTAGTSSVQRLSFKNTGLEDVRGVARELGNLTCLYQVDLGSNPGPLLTTSDANALQFVMQNNLALLHPSANASLAALIDGTEPAAEDEHDAAPTPERTKDSSNPNEPQQQQQEDPDHQRSQPPTAAGHQQQSRSDPAQQDSTHHHHQQQQQQNHGPPTGGQQQESQRQRSPPRRRANTATNATNASGGGGGAGTTPTKKTQQQTASSRTPQRSDRGTPQRTRSPATPSTPRTPRTTASPARRSSTSMVQQRSVDDGADHWKEVCDKYNGYIRAGSPGRSSATASPLRERALKTPRWVLGKRVEDRPTPSSAFKASAGRVRERAPTPEEVRKYAPWNQKRDADHEPKVGEVTKVKVDDGDAFRPPTYVTFVDGGKQTYVENDPRELGYFARRVQSGLVKSTNTMYKSNAPRDMRWGTSAKDKTFVHRSAQAPGPGAYSIPDPWEKQAAELRERAKAKSGTRDMFNGSAAPRLLGTDKKPKVDERDFYDIP